MRDQAPSQPRVAALVGPLSSGKTSLLESLLSLCGALPRKGTVKDKNTVGDASMEAKLRQMSVELNVASAEFLGERWTFLDAPGSVEFAQDAHSALMVSDVAVVVCEPDPHKARLTAPLLRFLDERKIPHLIFINKMDGNGHALRETIAALQALSARPLVLRELPIREGEQITGFVDLVSERAYRLGSGTKSDLIPLPETLLPEEQEARREMLEHLADFDDHLLEELLNDVSPSEEELFMDFRKELAEDLIVPVFFGSAEKDHGVRRLLKALRHEAPEVTETATRMNIPSGKDALAQVFKTVHAQHVGKLSLARVWRGSLSDGMNVNGSRISGLHRLFGAQQQKLQGAEVGEIVALGRLEELHTGQGASPSGALALPWIEAPQPVASISLKLTKSADEVKLSGALTKLCEEDASLQVEPRPETHERILWGQGEIHLKTALDRLKSRFGLDVSGESPLVPYRETIRKTVTQHGRYKHQSGGHGAFGDVHLEIKALKRGDGFVFKDTIVGGVIPKNYFPAVEKGCVEYMKQGPLGFPVVDLQATLTHGSFHSVDSSDMAFQQAARIAMSEGLPQANPVLLEPILELQLSIPNEFTAKAQRLLTSRRGGQILGFDQKEGWNNWDVVNGYLPQAEMRDLIVELRSLTMGTGFFTWRFDRLQELEGKDAEKVVEARKQSLAHAH
jgi:elongation factor G